MWYCGDTIGHSNVTRGNCNDILVYSDDTIGHCVHTTDHSIGTIQYSDGTMAQAYPMVL